MSSSEPRATAAEVNALVENYYGTLGSVGYAEPLPLHPADTALVLVDIQQHLSTRSIRASLKQVGVYNESAEPVLTAIEADLQAALTNISLVLAKCREVGIRPIHVGIQSYLPDSADAGMLHKAAGMLYAPGSYDSQFLPEAAPLEGEIVLTKTCSGIHVGTHIDQVLRNLGAQNVIMTGFYTDQCVSASVRDLTDLGYRLTLVDDAMGAMSPERHQNALQSIRKLYANSESTEEILPRLDQIAAKLTKKKRGWLSGRHGR
ncbi:cysteine hydrolase family protein [Leucobacter manosquensis]|uniref:Cysteine hydrolase n=1 Tax=Leucobacter manosquensis TaxID=2810611 RepID=A0ABS5M6S4_9MICO|nr:isochorismatase family cysteine hydrolase [Leucobacter manosquensis]MBS3182371.1 cysteine hydrolase [Leucobacter manosquensis]